MNLFLLYIEIVILLFLFPPRSLNSYNILLSQILASHKCSISSPWAEFLFIQLLIYSVVSTLKFNQFYWISKIYYYIFLFLKYLFLSVFIDSVHLIISNFSWNITIAFLIWFVNFEVLVTLMLPSFISCFYSCCLVLIFICDFSLQFHFTGNFCWGNYLRPFWNCVTSIKNCHWFYSY